MVDISSIRPAERIYEILHPKTGAKLGVRIGLLSIDDAKMKKIRRKIQNERIQLQQRGKSFNADEQIENTKKIIIAAITHWDWYDADIDGRKPEFPEDASEVFDNYPWFLEQLDEQVGDTKSFFQG